MSGLSKNGVFISYRRGSANRVASAIRREIQHAYPSADVFHDGMAIDAGANWPDRIKTALDSSAVLIALVNDDWLTGRKGNRLRLDIESDWVRKELLRGIENNITILLVLIDGAEMPKDIEEFPHSLKKILQCQACPMRDAPYDEIEDLRRIVRVVGECLPKSAKVAQPNFIDRPTPDLIRAETVKQIIKQVVSSPREIYDLAMDQYYAGRYKLSELLFREAASKFEADQSPESKLSLYARYGVANSLLDLGRAQEAETEFEHLIKLREESEGIEHPATLATRNQHAVALVTLGELSKAISAFQNLVRIQEKKLGEGDPATLGSRHGLATALLDSGNRLDALAELDRLIPLRIAVQGDQNRLVLATRSLKARALLEAKRFEVSVFEYKELLPSFEAVLGHAHPWTLGARRGLARALLENGNFGQAREILDPVLNEPDDASTSPEGQTQLLETWLFDIEGKKERAENALVKSWNFVLHLPTQHPTKRQVQRYEETRVPGRLGGTTIW
ncbi:MAG: toll/interleukin-1 receptor domain-containing protein [Pseudomonadota bacterium]